MNRIKIYPAKVVTTSEDYTITFNIPGSTDNFTVFPSATPMFNKVRQVYADDDVLIWQLNEEIDDFMYLPYNPDENYTGLKFGNTLLDISDGEVIKLQVVKYPEPEENSSSEQTNAESYKGTVQPTEIENILTEILIDGTSITVNSNDDSGELKSSVSMNNDQIGLTVGDKVSSTFTSESIEVTNDKLNIKLADATASIVNDSVKLELTNSDINLTSNSNVNLTNGSSKVEITSSGIALTGLMGKLEVK